MINKQDPTTWTGQAIQCASKNPNAYQKQKKGYPRNRKRITVLESQGIYKS
jgi:hypothetical protein